MTYNPHYLQLMPRNADCGQKLRKECAYKISEKNQEKLVKSKIIYNFALAKAKHLRLDSGKASRRRDSSVG